MKGLFLLLALTLAFEVHADGQTGVAHWEPPTVSGSTESTEQQTDGFSLTVELIVVIVGCLALTLFIGCVCTKVRCCRPFCFCSGCWCCSRSPYVHSIHPLPMTQTPRPQTALSEAGVVSLEPIRVHIAAV
jgi:hypothetical protein